MRGFDGKMMTDIERIGQGAMSPAESVWFRLFLFKFHSQRLLRSHRPGMHHPRGLCFGGRRKNNIKIFYVAVGKAGRGWIW